MKKKSFHEKDPQEYEEGSKEEEAGESEAEEEEEMKAQGDRMAQINDILGKYIPNGKNPKEIQSKASLHDDRKARFLANMKKGREKAKSGGKAPVAGVMREKDGKKATPAA